MRIYDSIKCTSCNDILTKPPQTCSCGTTSTTSNVVSVKGYLVDRSLKRFPLTIETELADSLDSMASLIDPFSED